MGSSVGVIKVRATSAVDVSAVLGVIRQHWAGAREVESLPRPPAPMGLQKGRTTALGYAVARPSDGWITVVDSEQATADAALALDLHEALGVAVVWYCVTEAANAGDVRIYGEDDAGLSDPGEAEEAADVERWANAHFANALPLFGEQTEGADWLGVAFEGVDADLYVDDPTWLESAEVDAGAIQIRVKDGIDPERVAAEVAAYWVASGATAASIDVPEAACGVIAGESGALVVAVSPVIDGWITVVDSEREVADLGLADWLSAELDADVAWYWVSSSDDAAVIRLFGFEEFETEPADDVPSVLGFAHEQFPLPFAPIDAVDDSWIKLGFQQVDPDQYITNPEWLDNAIREADADA